MGLPIDHHVFVLSFRCEKCNRRWDDQKERWRIYFTSDDPPNAVTYCPECAERSSSATDAQEVRRALNLCTRSAARVKALTEWGGRYCGADRPRWSGLGAEPLRLADNPRRRLPERGSRPD